MLSHRGIVPPSALMVVVTALVANGWIAGSVELYEENNRLTDTRIVAARVSQPRDPILVYDYNKQPGKNFNVYYSKQAPQSVAPCLDTVAGIRGWVCPVGPGK